MERLPPATAAGAAPCRMDPLDDDDPPQMLYSARYATPPPPPHPRRPFLQFPPPPPYPPPDQPTELFDSQDVLLPSATYRPPESVPPHVQRLTKAHTHEAFNACCDTKSPSLPVRHCEGSNEELCSEKCVNNPPLPFRFKMPIIRGPISVEEDCALNRSASSCEAFEPNEYSYAYYEPGPPSNHTTALNNGSNVHNDRNSRHTYMTRYGTEENIYEEISEVATKCTQMSQQQQQQHSRSQLSLNQSVVEEEVRRVQSRHRRVLGELNLTVEAMLMPPPPPKDEETHQSAEVNKGSGPPDLLEDLLLSVGPTDELLSPASCNIGGDHDSGFSGSSGLSYNSASSIRKVPDRARSSQSFPRTAVHSSASSSGYTQALSHGRGADYHCMNKSLDLDGNKSQQSFWGRKGWIRLPGFNNSNSKRGIAWRKCPHGRARMVEFNPDDKLGQLMV